MLKQALVVIVSSIAMGLGIMYQDHFVASIGAFGACTMVTYRLLGRSIVVVAEHDTIVVKNWLQKRFTRVLLPGEYWLKPFEQAAQHLSTLPFPSSWTVNVVKSADGLPHDVSLRSNVQIRTDLIQGDLLSVFVEFLNKGAKSIVKSHVSDCLREVFGQYSADYLNDARNFVSLKQELTQKAERRLAFFGLELFSVHIGAVQPPASYQEALTLRRKRELQIEARTAALREMRDVLMTMSAEDKYLAVELELGDRQRAKERIEINHRRFYRPDNPKDHVIEGEFYVPANSPPRDHVMGD